MVKINGEPVAAAGKSVSAYLAEAGYDSAPWPWRSMK